MRHDHAALGQDQLDVAQAQAEAVIEPHRVLDDLSREAKAAVRVQRQVHGQSLPELNSHANLTTPLELPPAFLDTDLSDGRQIWWSPI